MNRAFSFGGLGHTYRRSAKSVCHPSLHTPTADGTPLLASQVRTATVFSADVMSTPSRLLVPNRVCLALHAHPEIEK